MKRKLKLKGKNAKRLSPDKKRKMERTLARMQETREKDDIHLRQLIKTKLTWAIAEKTKGVNEIKKLQTQANKIQAQINRIEGIILFCNDILNPEKEKK
jgi:hypothetical protein